LIVLRRMRTWLIVVSATVLLAMASVSVALAQVDSDEGDGDELSAASLLLVVGALAVVGWIAYRRRSTGPR
jgi:hypothetical protein